MTKPKATRRHRRGRQIWVARLRAEGLSLRQIAKEAGCSKSTVARDLAEAAKLSHLPVPKRGSRAPEWDSGRDTANVIPLRRKAP
jgi:transposase